MKKRSKVPPLIDEWGKSHDEGGKYEVKGDAPLSLKAIAVKLPVEVYEAIKAMPKNERGDWLRMVICEAAKLDGLL